MVSSKKVEKVIIVGSGPAAHTAAIYAGRGELNPLLFEGFMAGGIAAGGQLTTTTEVENFPGFPKGISGSDLMASMREQSLRYGCRILTETIVEVDLTKKPYQVVTEGKEKYFSHTIIISTGATAKKIKIPNGNTYWQKGISACAICDGALPIFKKKDLFVVGGGDSACEEAVFLTKYASMVYLVHRRETLRASKIMQQRVLNNDKIEILFNHEVVNVLGDGKILKKVVLNRNDTNRQYEKLSGGLFFAIGHKPNTDFLKGQLKLDAEGYILTEPGTTKTNISGVFACGDVQDKRYRQAITAAGTGCMACLEVEAYLSSHNLS